MKVFLRAGPHSGPIFTPRFKRQELSPLSTVSYIDAGVFAWYGLSWMGMTHTGFQ
jgi:hypothetical protein